MNLKEIMLSNISQTEKDNYYMIPLIRVTRTVKFIETENSGCQGLRRATGECRVRK